MTQLAVLPLGSSGGNGKSYLNRMIQTEILTGYILMYVFCVFYLEVLVGLSSKDETGC